MAIARPHAQIFTLGTPFRGHPVTFLFPFTYATLQMNPLSPFMRETKAKYRTLSSIQAVFARFDEILFFKHLNIPGRFDDVKLAQVGHANLFMGPAGIECITELIAAEEATDPKPVPVKDANGKVVQPLRSQPQKLRPAEPNRKRPRSQPKPSQRESGAIVDASSITVVLRQLDRWAFITVKSHPNFR
jgi:hypothetical protein